MNILIELLPSIINESLQAWFSSCFKNSPRASVLHFSTFNNQRKGQTMFFKIKKKKTMKHLTQHSKQKIKTK